MKDDCEEMNNNLFTKRQMKTTHSEHNLFCKKKKNPLHEMTWIFLGYTWLYYVCTTQAVCQKQ